MIKMRVFRCAYSVRVSLCRVKPYAEHKRYGAVKLWTFWPNTPTIEGEIIAHKDSMMTMRRATLFSLALFAGAALYAQVSDLPPFVSRLTAVTCNDGVFLSWHDNDEAEGNYKVYTHTEEISEANIADARLLSAVEHGVQEYTDTPTTEGPHYYAVLASNAEGEEYLFFVPFSSPDSSKQIFLRHFAEASKH